MNSGQTAVGLEHDSKVYEMVTRTAKKTQGNAGETWAKGRRRLSYVVLQDRQGHSAPLRDITCYTL